MCKNGLLNFNEAERAAVIRMFHAALDDNDLFVMGQAQKLPSSVQHLFVPASSNAQLFRKVVQ